MSKTSPPAAPLSCLLLLDDADTGSAQMAVDEMLLDSAAEAGRCWLRFYRWSEPTLSLGYFQSYADRSLHPASGDAACVRRMTGGGAILHDRELTYSLALPGVHPLARDATRLYDAVHDALIRVLAELGLRAERCATGARRATHSEPFLCFERRARCDVLLGDAKICGSAQRRRRGAVLQHGSLLLARSPLTPELPGILEVGHAALDAGDVAARWAQTLSGSLGLSLVPGETSPSQRQSAGMLNRGKYRSDLWTRRR